MMTRNYRCRPLLRGTLMDLLPWRRTETGLLVRDATIAVWCPFCTSMHYHGWSPERDGRWAEHRCCHCTNEESPFHKTGYYISVWRKTDPEYKSHIVTPGKRIERI